MLVTTFAIAFLLQAVALIVDVRDGTIGEVAPSLSSLSEPVTIGGTDIRKITLVSIGVAVAALLLLVLLLTRTTIGLHTRAAAERLPHRAPARRAREPRDRVLGACSRACWPPWWR